MKKRLLCLLLAFSMLLTMLPVYALAEEAQTQEEIVSWKNPFWDVQKGDWFHDAVQYVRVNGIFNGTSELFFEPDGSMTRGMFVTVLGRMAGVAQEDYAGQSSFVDVDADDYYAPYVAWAARHGITSGTSETEFSPNALIDRQQMAAFFVRYFDAFGVTYETGENIETIPADLDSVAEYARGPVLALWKQGLLNGDGVSFDPYSNASRSQTAALCMRADEAVLVWYREPGVESDRVRIPLNVEEETEEEKAATGVAWNVTFMDGSRIIDTLIGVEGEALDALPEVEKSSKEGHILLGYYLDEEFTKPFYPDDPIAGETRVYAKYQKMEDGDNLAPRTFTQMDQDPGLSFVIEEVTDPAAGKATDARLAANVVSKDGSDPVRTEAIDNGDGTYTIRAIDGFSKGCSYELILDNGWIFSGKEPTIRIASFSIKMEEVENLRMGDEVVYLQDTDRMSYLLPGEEQPAPVLTAELMNKMTKPEDTGIFSGCMENVKPGDILCIYTGTHPEERGHDSDLLDPAVYVKVSSVSGGTVTFTTLDEADQQALYEVPDNFPILVSALPEGGIGTTGTVLLEDLDPSMYEDMLGKEEGVLAKAIERLSKGDYVTMYTGSISSEDDLRFGLVTGFEKLEGSTKIEYTLVEKQDILDSMDLYTKVDLNGDDLLSETEAKALEASVLAQVEESGFAEDAAFLLADLVTKTDAFRADVGVQDLLLTDAEGNALPEEQIELLGSGSFELNDVDLSVSIQTGGAGMRYDGGVQVVIGVTADFTVETEDGVIAIQLAASFSEAVDIEPGVHGDLVYKEILFIPVPIGVHISANVDIRNFTAFDFEAYVTTHDDSGSVVSQTDIVSDLDELMDTAEKKGLGHGYYESLDSLMEKYSRMMNVETDWIKLVEEEIYTFEVFYMGLVIGVETDFVVRADMNIAIGSSLQYEVGKRYSFWFEIGLFTPSSGSDTMDLLDEQFAFNFYVMGKLGVKAGIKAKIYVGIGSGKLASVGIAAELGPYIKLWGLFIYDYTRIRPAGSSQWTTTKRMIGGLNLEFGMYFILSFEAEALGLFEYSYDFINKEYPLLTAGEPLFYYGLTYQPSDVETVYIWDDDENHENGISMILPDLVHALSYVNLKTGAKGNRVESFDKFVVTLSNPAFTFDPASGSISVSVPETVRYMECDMTLTYLHGKMAFTNYDMTTTIHLAWTDLSVAETQQYKTVSVQVGNEEEGYETVWSKRVFKGQPFDLPTDAEIRRLSGWNDLKFNDTSSGYVGLTDTTDLTVIEDTVYTYHAKYQVYGILVEGIETPTDGITSRTYYARYGEAFDFSDLEGIGTDDPATNTYTRFANVTTDAKIQTELVPSGSGYALGEQPMDLTQPINGKMAEALKAGGVTAKANYVDDSVTAIFTFNGLTHEDVTVTLRKGGIPSLEKVQEVLDEAILENNGNPQVQLGIGDLHPALSAIDCATNYVVDCVTLSGQRAMVSFNVRDNHPGTHIYYKDAPDPVDKLVGSLIVNIPVADRRGYTFMGWFTEPSGEGEDAFTQTVPAEGITLYARWKANTYLTEFDVKNGDTTHATMVTTYDNTYDNGNRKVETADSTLGYVKGEAYGKLPFPKRTGYGFVGWSTQDYAFGASRAKSDASHVENSTIANIYDEDHTLYAQWKNLVAIPQNLFQFTKQTVVYNGQDRSGAIQYSINQSLSYTYETFYAEDNETRYFSDLNMDDFTILFKKQGMRTEWSAKAINAGTYDVRIVRHLDPTTGEGSADNDFRSFDYIYSGVLVIEKAPSAINSNPGSSNITSQHYANLITNPSGLSYEGDGDIEFGTTSSANGTPSNWSSGVVYDVKCDSSGQFYLWARVGEGLNYKASTNAKCSGPISLTEAPSGATPTYKIVLKTADVNKAGTDSKIFVTINGGTEKALPHGSGSGDKLYEKGKEDTADINGGGWSDRNGAVTVKIRLEKNGSAPGWCLEWFRIDTYLNGTKIHEGTKVTQSGDDRWFLASECEASEKTFTNVNVFGRNMTYDISGPAASVGTPVTINLKDQTSDLTFSMDQTVAERKMGNYDPYQYRSAPKFEVKFTKASDSVRVYGFDDLISWSISGGKWVAVLDTSALKARMEANGIYSVYLYYGVFNDPDLHKYQVLLTIPE